MQSRKVRHVPRRRGGPGRVPTTGPKAPNAHLRLWILDINGTRLVIAGTSYPDTSQQDRDDLDTLLNSIQIDASSRPSSPATTILSTRPQRPPPHLRKTIEHPPGRRGRRDGPTSHDESATDSPFGRRRVVGDALALDGLTSARTADLRELSETSRRPNGNRPCDIRCQSSSRRLMTRTARYYSRCSRTRQKRCRARSGWRRPDQSGQSGAAREL